MLQEYVGMVNYYCTAGAYMYIQEQRIYGVKCCSFGETFMSHMLRTDMLVEVIS